MDFEKSMNSFEKKKTDRLHDCLLDIPLHIFTGILFINVFLRKIKILPSDFYI